MTAHLVAVEQSQSVVQPLRTPPLPAEAPAIPGSHHVPPYFQLYPVLDELEAPAGVANGEVVHPPPQNRVDDLDYPVHRLGSMSPKDHSQLLQQCRSLLQLGRVLRPPVSLQTTDTTEVEAQEPEALAAGQVDGSALLFVDLDLQLGELLPQALVHRFQQPVIAWLRVDQDHRIVSEPRILDGDELPIACGLFCPLQHPVHLVEVEVTEDGRNHTPLRDALFAVRLQHDLQKVHPLIIVDPLGYLGEEQIVSHSVEIGLQINIDHACFPPHHRI